MEKDNFMEKIGATAFKSGTEKINTHETNKLCNEICNEVMSLIISKIVHIEPRGMFNVALNSAIYLLTSIFTNVLCQSVHPKDHEEFKSSVIKQISDNFSKVLDTIKKGG